MGRTQVVFQQPARSADSRLHLGLIHHIMFACVLPHAQSKRLTGPGLGHMHMVNFHRIDTLRKIAGVTLDVNCIPHSQGPGLKLHDRR